MDFFMVCFCIEFFERLVHVLIMHVVSLYLACVQQKVFYTAAPLLFGHNEHVVTLKVFIRSFPHLLVPKYSLNWRLQKQQPKGRSDYSRAVVLFQCWCWICSVISTESWLEGKLLLHEGDLSSVVFYSESQPREYVQRFDLLSS